MAILVPTPNDAGRIPWILTTVALALWGLFSILAGIFGGFRAHRRVTAAPVVTTRPEDTATRSNVRVQHEYPTYSLTRDVARACRDLLLLLLVPTIVNQVYGFFSWPARIVIILIFALGIVWVFLRLASHRVVILHRFVNFLMVPLVILSIIAAVMGVRDAYGDVSD